MLGGSSLETKGVWQNLAPPTWGLTLLLAAGPLHSQIPPLLAKREGGLLSPLRGTLGISVLISVKGGHTLIGGQPPLQLLGVFSCGCVLCLRAHTALDQGTYRILVMGLGLQHPLLSLS